MRSARQTVQAFIVRHEITALKATQAAAVDPRVSAGRAIGDASSGAQVRSELILLTCRAGWVVIARRERAIIQSCSQEPKAMNITRSGDIPSAVGPADYFSGRVRIDAPFNGSGALGCATVTFDPGARTAWHTHPLGQTILITFGLGLVQREGGPIEQVRPGDMVFFAPDERHWHGASTSCAMTHIAITEMKDGKAVDWLEQVTDAEYAGEAM